MKRIICLVLILMLCLSNVAIASAEDANFISFETPKWNALLKMLSDEYYKQYKEESTFTAMDLFENAPGMLAGAIAVDIIPVAGGVSTHGAYVVRIKDSVGVLLMWETTGYLIEILPEGGGRYAALENCTESKLQTLAEGFGEGNVYEVDGDELNQQIISMMFNVD